MHNDIYFNEPGWAGMKNTPNGKNKNEAYCKFIRAANMKFAMLEQIKNPTPEFKHIIHWHFYLNKKNIIKQIEKWQKLIKDLPTKSF